MNYTGNAFEKTEYKIETLYSLWFVKFRHGIRLLYPFVQHMDCPRLLT